VDQIYESKNREGNFKLKYDRVLFYAHEIALLNNIFENQDLKKHSAS